MHDDIHVFLLDIHSIYFIDILQRNTYGFIDLLSDTRSSVIPTSGTIFKGNNILRISFF